MATRAFLSNGGDPVDPVVFSSAVRFFNKDSESIHGSGVVLNNRWVLSAAHNFRGGFSGLVVQSELDLKNGHSGTPVMQFHFPSLPAPVAPDAPRASWPPPVGKAWWLDQVCLAELDGAIEATYPRIGRIAGGQSCMLAGFGRNPSNPTAEPGHLLGGRIRITAEHDEHSGFYVSESHAVGSVWADDDDSGAPYYSFGDFGLLLGIHCCTLLNGAGERRSALISLVRYLTWISSKIGVVS